MVARPEVKAVDPPQAVSIAKEVSDWTIQLIAFHAPPISTEGVESGNANVIKIVRAEKPGRPPDSMTNGETRVP